MQAGVVQKQDQEIAFDFGENWAEFSEHVGDEHVGHAREKLERLLGDINIQGKRFIDIGCGSGLHALAALQLGAGHVRALDINPASVATTSKVLRGFWDGENYDVRQVSILDDAHKDIQKADVVYSWGVLHHTGDMDQAISNAASLVSDGGYFIIALYKKTPFCGFWKVEKKIYTALPKFLRPIFDYAYAAVQCLGLLVTGRNPVTYIKEYKEKRGMRWMNDIKDWLGGTPYESISPAEVKTQVEALGFEYMNGFHHDPSPVWGILGSGCGEYVFKKR